MPTTIAQGDTVRVVNNDSLQHGVVGTVEEILKANTDYRRRAWVRFTAGSESYRKVIALDFLELVRNL